MELCFWPPWRGAVGCLQSVCRELVLVPVCSHPQAASFLSRTHSECILRTTAPSWPSPAWPASSRSPTGATSPWRRTWTWSTRAPCWKGLSRAMITRGSRTVGSPPSALSRCGLLGLDTGRHCDCLVRKLQPSFSPWLGNWQQSNPPPQKPHS